MSETVFDRRTFLDALLTTGFVSTALAIAYPVTQFIVPPEGISFKEVITDFEKRLIESTLEAAGGVQKRAAELLHIKPTTLNEMIKRYDIRPRRRRQGNGNGIDLGHEPESASAHRAPEPTVQPPFATVNDEK